jgi:hypothetical protein
MGMRKTILAAAALSVLLVAASGCLNQASAPTSGSTSTISKVGAVPRSATTGTGNAPGSGSHPSGGILIRPVHAEKEANGFFVSGDESASGAMQGNDVTFTFTAQNRGADAQVLQDPCGGGNPKIHMEDANGTILQIQPPQVHCMAMAFFAPFGHAGNVSRELTWNGTTYSGGKASMASPGTYFAVGTFEGKRGDTVVDVTVKVPVNLFEKSATQKM